MSITMLLDSIRDHLTTYELPEPWNVDVNATEHDTRAQVTVQLSCRALPEVASTLLTWADTLSDVSTEAWRIPHGTSVHLALRGRLEDGTKVHVFDGVPHDERFHLDPKERRLISLALLREWATLDEEVVA